MTLRFHQVDAFTDVPFAGNPAAVCLLPEERDEGWMQRVAREMNLSETAFLVAKDDGYGLRWFTPSVEVDLCGHATLACAHVLAETGVLDQGGAVRFHTLSGVLTAERHGDEIVLDFPSTPAEYSKPAEGLIESLGVNPVAVGRSRFDYLVEVATEAEVRGVVPDFTRLGKIPVRGVMVTARSSAPEYDFVSRFFAPAVGVDEDPVTGSAHCCLAPYWASHLGKDEMVGYQASERGGVVRVRLAGDRVKLAGKAVTVLRGELVGGAA